MAPTNQCQHFFCKCDDDDDGDDDEDDNHDGDDGDEDDEDNDDEGDNNDKVFYDQHCFGSKTIPTRTSRDVDRLRLGCIHELRVFLLVWKHVENMCHVKHVSRKTSQNIDTMALD